MRPFLYALYRSLLSLPRLGLGGALTLLIASLRPGTYRIKPKGYLHPLSLRGRSSDPYVFWLIIVREEYRRHYNRPISTIVDLGANTGYVSVFFAHAFPQARIIAVEPEAGNFAMLKENTRHYPQITVEQAAIASAPGTLYLQNASADHWGFQFAASVMHGSAAVPAITMPDLMERHGISTISLAKIDIEGGEKDLFSANTKWLDATEMILIELHAGCWKTVFEAMRPYDYDCRHTVDGVFFDLHGGNG